MENILHYPQLDSILMVEKIIQKMKKYKSLFALGGILILMVGCATAYRATPLPFRAPASYPNATQIANEDAIVGAQAFADPKKAEEAFGFDIRGAGMLPVQVVSENE